MGAMHFADYISRSDRLIAAGRTVLLAIEDRDVDINLAKEDVEIAAEGGTTNLAFYFEGAEAGAPVSAPALTPEDVLSGLLLDFQSANLLISTGLTTGEQAVQADPALLVQALQQIESSQANIALEISEAREALGFNAEKLIQSADLPSATACFKQISKSTLEQFVDELQKVVSSVLEHLGKLDVDKILDAFNRLGESVTGVVEAGRLVGRGIEKLKGAIEALFRIIGKEGLEYAKATATEIWNKFKSGEYTRDTLAWLLDVRKAEARIGEILAFEDLQLEAIDRASNALAPLLEGFKKDMKLIHNLLVAVVLAASGLGLLHIAMPWLPVLTATAYIALLAAAVLIGRDYSDSGKILHWVKGIGEIAQEILAAR